MLKSDIVFLLQYPSWYSKLPFYGKFPTKNSLGIVHCPIRNDVQLSAAAAANIIRVQVLYAGKLEILSPSSCLGKTMKLPGETIWFGEYMYIFTWYKHIHHCCLYQIIVSSSLCFVVSVGYTI
jgi:hypothetical protein